MGLTKIRKTYLCVLRVREKNNKPDHTSKIKLISILLYLRPMTNKFWENYIQ